MHCQGDVCLKAIMLLWIKIPDAKAMPISSIKKTDALFWVSTTACAWKEKTYPEHAGSYYPIEKTAFK